MQNTLKLHHVGYAVPDIKTTAKEFEKLGFLHKETLYDEALTVELCYLEKDGTIIELVCQKNPDSLEAGLLKKNGIMPYHLCFSCKDIFSVVNEMVANGYEKLFSPVEVKALGGKKICYLFKKEVGYMELVEE
ncbi:MAG: VOC family protein [Bacteroidales bacterium]|nr:VOC family protein [Bacteroidales bacterium]